MTALPQSLQLAQSSGAQGGYAMGGETGGFVYNKGLDWKTALIIGGVIIVLWLMMRKA